MRTIIKLLSCAICLTAIGSAADPAQSNEWKQLVKDRIKLYGHRNWIVIADSAYPAQSRDGIETIVSNSDQLEVLQEVLKDISSSSHVRPIPYTDRELQFVSDLEAPGIDVYRDQLFALLPDAKTHSQLHEQIIHKLDEAGQTFRVLIIKTNMTIPYTTVFLQLDCAYWSDASEQSLRAHMAH